MNISPLHHIGIIGGEGRTGGQFARLFTDRGFCVSVTGNATADRNAALLRECDIVIFAVPLAASVEVIRREIAHATRADQLILDVSSLKGPQVAEMIRAPGEVIGMHPLFAPTTDPRGQTVILCPARAGDGTLASLESLLQSMDLRTFRKTAEEHDRLMTFVQALPHLKSLLMAETLREMGADMEEVAALCTPAYEIELNVIGRFLDDDPALYGPIILANPQTIGMLRVLRSRLDSYLDMAERGDQSAFADTYTSLRTYFAPVTVHARARSEACIRALSSFPS
jgi:prephenate dehydrogenase